MFDIPETVAAEICYTFEGMLRAKFPEFGKKIRYDSAERIVKTELRDGWEAPMADGSIRRFSTPSLHWIRNFKDEPNCLGKAYYNDNDICFKRIKGCAYQSVILHEIAHFKTCGHHHGRIFILALVSLYRKYYGLKMTQLFQVFGEAHASVMQKHQVAEAA